MTTVKLRYKYPVWYNNDIKHKLKLKTKFHKLFKITKNQIHYNLFSQYRTESKRLIQTAYNEYIVSVETNISLNPTYFLNYIKSKQNCSCLSLPMLDLESESICDGQDIAQAFAKYFVSTFSTEATDNSWSTYNSSSNSTNTSLLHVSKEQIEKAIRILKNTKSC